MIDRDPFRELGTIDSFFYGIEDHGILTCNLGIDFGGSHQGFGNLVLDADKMGPDFLRDLFAIFGKKPGDTLTGEKVFALRCFDTWNTTIEGLESERTKRRFILTDWRRKFNPKTLGVLQSRRQSIVEDIASRERDLERAREQLRTIDAGYRAVKS